VYNSLRKVCPKDEYPLPRFYQIIDSIASCELLSFLDAYSGYHQISLAIDDEEKAVFITPFGIYCYNKMAFDLNKGELHIRGAFKSSLKLKSDEMSRHILMML
jgi:hypothetical protein